MEMHNKPGTKERLLEMFEKVNEIEINQSPSDLAIDSILEIIRTNERPEYKLKMIEDVINHMYDNTMKG